MPAVRLVVVLVVAAALRVALFALGLDAGVAHSYEASTPLSSFARVCEGVFLRALGHSPYAGASVHAPPLVLAGLAPLVHSPALSAALFTAADLLAAALLYAVGAAYARTYLVRDLQCGKDLKTPDKGALSPPAPLTAALKALVLPSLPLVMAVLFAFNPLSLLACLARSTAIFETIAVLTILWAALCGVTSVAAVALAVGTYLSGYSVALLPPTALLLAAPTRTSPLAQSVRLVAVTTAVLGGLLWLSHAYLQSWEFLEKSYGAVFLVPDLQPNIGLFWYYLAEMFPNFRLFFVVVLQYHIFLYVWPLCYAVRGHPDLVWWLQVGIAATFRAYPSTADVALLLALVPLFYHKIQGFLWGFAMLGGYVYLTLLYPIFYRIWIIYGSGNVNFYYALNLVTAFVNSTVLTEALAAVLKRDFLMKQAAKSTR